MHELTLARAIVDIAAAHADGHRVAAVDVRVGRLRQVVPSALAFAFEVAAQGTPAGGAELRIEEVDAGLRCRACGFDGVLRDFPLRCESCGSAAVDVSGGDELLVESLELEDPEATLLTTCTGRR